jgi:hypothetical protein
MRINMKKKSQIAVFIVLAVLIGGLILTAVIYRPKEDIKPVINKIDPINSFVLNCLKETGEDAVYYIGYTGGYYNNPNLTTDNNIAYYFYEEKDLMPSKVNVENELSEYMNNMLFFCTKEFRDFPDYNITQGEIKTKTTIEDERVIFNVNYPLTINKENNNYRLNEFKDIEIPVRLGIVYNAAREIMDEQMFNKKEICISCLLKLSLKNKLRVDMNDKEDKVVIFTITDASSYIKDKEFKFNFANKYE